MTLKVKFLHFLTPTHYTNLQNSMISFDYRWFLAKTSPILYPSLENSITGIAITVSTYVTWIAGTSLHAKRTKAHHPYFYSKLFKILWNCHRQFIMRINFTRFLKSSTYNMYLMNMPRFNEFSKYPYPEWLVQVYMQKSQNATILHTVLYPL